MKNKEFIKLEEKAIELFGNKATVIMTTARTGDKGYTVKLGVTGLPFEISASAKTYEFALEIAMHAFEDNLAKSLRDNLFKTQDDECYEKVILSEEQLSRLYSREEYISESYLKEITEKTNVWVCKIRENKYECVIESPYLSLHARGYGMTGEAAILSAIMRAQDVFEPEPIRVDENNIHL